MFKSLWFISMVFNREFWLSYLCTCILFICTKGLTLWTFVSLCLYICMSSALCGIWLLVWFKLSSFDRFIACYTSDSYDNNWLLFARYYMYYRSLWHSGGVDQIWFQRFQFCGSDKIIMLNLVSKIPILWFG